MPGLSDVWEKMMLRHIFKRGGPNSNTGTGGFTASQFTLYVSLHGTDPTDDFTTAQSTELTGLSYARASISTDLNFSTHTYWNDVDAPSSAQRITNKADIVFPAATGNWNSGNPIPYFGLWQQPVGGTAEHFIGTGVINPSVTILNGNTFTFFGGSPGNLQFTAG